MSDVHEYFTAPVYPNLIDQQVADYERRQAELRQLEAERNAQQTLAPAALSEMTRR